MFCTYIYIFLRISGQIDSCRNLRSNDLPNNLCLVAASPDGNIIPFINALRRTLIVSNFKYGYVPIEIKFLKVGWSHNIGFKMAVILWKR